MTYADIDVSTSTLDDRASRLEIMSSRYAEELRAIGQTVEGQSFARMEIQVQSTGYRVRFVLKESDKPGFSLGAMLKRALRSVIRSQNRPSARSGERHYNPREIVHLIQKGITRRQAANIAPDPFSLSHILRTVGAYLDGLDRATLMSVTVEDRWINIRYNNATGQSKELKQDIQFFYDYWVKLYLRRSDRMVTFTPTLPTYTTW